MDKKGWSVRGVRAVLQPKAIEEKRLYIQFVAAAVLPLLPIVPNVLRLELGRCGELIFTLWACE